MDALQCCLKGCWLSLLWLWLCLSPASAAEHFLAAEQAFRLDVQSITAKQVALHWQIADGYYLYQQRFAVHDGQQALKLDLPQAQPKHDVYFGDTQVYVDQVKLQLAVLPKHHYRLSYQGCAEKGLCYPVQQISFSTDADGLVVLSPSAESVAQPKGLFSQPATPNLTPQPARLTSPADPLQAQAVAQDQQWSVRLQQQSLWWSMVVFLGMGCLLAFSPCSLPMLPILSSLLIGQKKGWRVGLISLSFVLSMATVYALLGLLAVSAGSNLQRWLQQPMVLIGFSAIFVLFALNLLGCFELRLPQRWANRVNHWQSAQHSGSVSGAALMGIFSALLVGPCMTAPLAGILLYIAQTQHSLFGAVLLFSLGLGMGIPLLLLCMVGSRVLPRPGPWMQQLRYGFAVVMLGLSLYFLRPILPADGFALGMLLLALVMALYLIWLLLNHQHWVRYLALVLLLAVTATTLWQTQQYLQQRQQLRIQWQKVEDLAQFESALAQAKTLRQPVLIDVYADWCIACQPIERQVWTDPRVQAALTSVTKIKLDLSHYQASQQHILNQWQILGPPTVLFLNADQHEQRQLRLTGEFNTRQLLQQIQQLAAD
jgi:thiol:disulfide interchange protein DsbD